MPWHVAAQNQNVFNNGIPEGPSEVANPRRALCANYRYPASVRREVPPARKRFQIDVGPQAPRCDSDGEGFKKARYSPICCSVIRFRLL